MFVCSFIFENLLVVMEMITMVYQLMSSQDVVGLWACFFIFFPVKRYYLLFFILFPGAWNANADGPCSSHIL